MPRVTMSRRRGAAAPDHVDGGSTPRSGAVVAMYQVTRAWARWRTTLRLRWVALRSGGRAQPGVSDQLRGARLSAVRDELAARGKPDVASHQGPL